MGLQCGDKSGTGGSQAAGAGPPSQPHVQDKLLPTQGTGVAQPGTSGKEGRDAERGLQECAMGTLRHPLRPGRGLLPPGPAGLPAEQINLSSTSKARTGLPKALCSVQSGGVQGQLGSRAASPLLLRTGTSPEPQHPNPQLCPARARGTARVPRCSQRLPSGRTRHTPGLGTGTNRTIFGDGLEPDPTLLRLPTAPHELGVFVPSRLISAARCVPAFRDTQAHVASAFAAQPFS